RGIGRAGADIFVREGLAVGPATAPSVDGTALLGAERLGLPTSPAQLAGLAELAAPPRPARQAGRGEPTDGRGIAVLAAALVRAALDKHIVDDVRAHA
ncbi:hypothetical protein ACFV6W_41730, partial [Streptomyces sp. NPDC059802]